MTSSERGTLAALAAAGAVSLVWPSDVPFINDEPILIINAVHANSARHLATTGLTGTFGFIYGPLPTWMYQGLTAVTHDLVLVAALHAALMVAATAAALWWVSRSLRLWPWFAAVPLLSPYFWFDARVLWDNPLLIPLGALAIAGYAANLTSGSVFGLHVAVAAMIAILLVHLMGIAFVLPLALHMTVRGRTLWRHRIGLATIAATACVLAWPYWRALAATPASEIAAAPSVDGLLLPLFGARLLTARQLDYFFGQSPVSGPVLRFAAGASAIAYVLAWIGLALAVSRVSRAVRSGQWTPRAHIAVIVLGMLVCQAVIHSMSGKSEHAQYYNSTWIGSILLAWFAVDAMIERHGVLQSGAAAATGLLAVSLLIAVTTIAVRLHRSGGTREVYGPTLGNQQRVARTIARYAPDSRVVPHVDLYDRYPHTLAALRELNPGGAGYRPERTLEVRYASDDPASGTIVVQ